MGNKTRVDIVFPTKDELARRKGVFATRKEDEIFGRRLIGGQWLFFDLGTRLQSKAAASDFTTGLRPIDSAELPAADDGANFINEYVEIELDALGEFTGATINPNVTEGDTDPYAFGTQHVQAEIEAAYVAAVAAWDAKLLGASDPLDPFGTTPANGSGRPLPNCQPIWFGADNQPSNLAAYNYSTGYQPDPFDIILTPVAGGAPETYPNSKLRETVEDLAGALGDFDTHWATLDFVTNPKWEARTIGDDEAAERWNALNRTQSGADISKDAQMQLGAGAGYHVRIDSRLIYEHFDTADTTNYKVTAAPDFSADEVSFSLGKSQARFYLKPKWLAFMREFSYDYSGSISYITYRVPTSDSGFQRLNFTTAKKSKTGTPSALLTFENFLYGSPDTARVPHGTIVEYECLTLSPPSYKLTIAGTSTTYNLTLADSGVPQTHVQQIPGYNVKVTCTVTFFHNGVSWSGDSPGEKFTWTVDTDNWFDATDPSLDVWNVAFNTVGASANASAKIQRGVFIGRYPVFPRNITANWYSVRAWFGDSNYDDYDADVALTKDGRIVQFTPAGSISSQRTINTAVYQRHPLRDTKDLIYNSSKLAAFLPAASGQSDDLYESGRVTADIDNAGAGLSSYDAQMDTHLADIETQITGAGHLHLMTTPSGSGSVSDDRLMHFFPVDAPAGLLCGVIATGTTRYYIWRKTTEARGGFDFDRNQGAGFLNTF